MAPPSALPRLASLTPASVALSAAEHVLAHLGRLSFTLGIEFSSGLTDGRLRVTTAEILATESQLGATLQQLTTYAQTGDAGDWRGFEAQAVEDATQTILGVLYDRPAARGDLGPLGPSDSDDAQPYGIAIRAAWARAALGEGRTPEAAWLAALVGLSPTQVRALRRGGELPEDVGELRAWCSRRGVVGLDAPGA